MKREDLKKLGLTDEQIGEVMKLHGFYFKNQPTKEAYGKILTEKRKLEAELNDNKKALDDFKKQEGNSDNKGGGIDETKLKDKIKAELEEEYSKKLKEAEFEKMLEIELLKQHPVSTKALKAELDLSGIKLSGGKLEGLTEQLDAIKADDRKALFKAEQRQNIRFGAEDEGNKGGTGNDTIGSVLAEWQNSLNK